MHIDPKTSIAIISLATIPILLFYTCTSLAYWSNEIPRAGDWEYQAVIQVQNIPMNIPPRIYKQCLDKNNPVPQVPDAGKCSITSTTRSGKEVYWKLQCQEQFGKREGRGKVRFEGNYFSGELEMSIHRTDYVTPYRFSYRLKGKRRAACQK